MSRTVRVAPLLLAASLALPPIAEAQASCRTPPDACAFVDSFLAALNRRDWAAFRATLDDSISIFLEDPAPPQRFDGRNEAETFFSRLFPAPGAAAVPTLTPIVPEHLRAQDLGSVVVVTFEIARPLAKARRTLVLRRLGTGWRIVHIHGSARPTPAE